MFAVNNDDGLGKGSGGNSGCGGDGSKDRLGSVVLSAVGGGGNTVRCASVCVFLKRKTSKTTCSVCGLVYLQKNNAQI